MSRVCIYFVTQTDLLCLTLVLNLSAFCWFFASSSYSWSLGHGCRRVAGRFITDEPRGVREEQPDRMCGVWRQKLRETLRCVHMRGL